MSIFCVCGMSVFMYTYVTLMTAMIQKDRREELGLFRYYKVITLLVKLCSVI